jgi:hypothetical protein
VMCINSVKETGSRSSNEVVSRADLGIAVIPSLLTGMGRRLAQPRSPHPVNWEPIIPCANFVSLFDFLGPFLLIFLLFGPNSDASLVIFWGPPPASTGPPASVGRAGHTRVVRL